ncbi:MAG: sugar phosphate isomerase/epimerase [Bacteroidia bacterium]|nr:sugar phosphate isomerase/epimerase [Bacteroidia bacterium]
MKTRQSRREFLKITAAGAIGAAFISQYGCKSFYRLGLQLYSIRDAMTADAQGSLKIVSDIGYKYVELADYANRKFYNRTPDEFLKMVKDLGMEILSSHTQVEGAGVTLDNAKIMAEDHAKLGVKYCLQPWIVEEMRTTIASYQRMAENWNKIGAVMKEYGIQFGYHNHNFEFATVEGKVPYFDVMLAELDKDLVTMELDMFWASKAGQNPVDLIKKYPGRFQLYHLKDMYTREAPFFDVIKTDIAPVGEGVIDFKEIIAAGDIAGMKYMIVEQDQSKNGTIMEDIKTSFTNLTTKILV